MSGGQKSPRRIVVGVSGASGAVYAVSLLKALRACEDVETHGVLSSWAKENIRREADMTVQEFRTLLDYEYGNKELGAAISSGSFITDAMVVIPASMKSVASIAHGLSDTLIARAADVTLKEQRKLIIVPRESPLSTIHLENLLKLSRMGVQIIPPMPAFYHRPRTIQDLILHHTMRVLDALGIDNTLGARWEG